MNTASPEVTDTGRPTESWRERHASSIRQMRLYWHTYRRNASAMVGLVLVVIFLLLSLISPWIVPYPADATGAVHMADKLLPPSAAHWFGTDEVGNDILTRLLIGTRLSLEIAVIITGVAAIIGVPLGILAGFSGARSSCA